MSRNKENCVSPRGDIKRAGYLAGNRRNIAARRNRSLSHEEEAVEQQKEEEEAASRSGCTPTASLIWLQQNLSEHRRHAGAYKGAADTA